jgi:hypothetical protein
MVPRIGREPNNTYMRKTMQDQQQTDELRVLLSRVATSLEVTATIQLLAIKYPNAQERDAQLAALQAQRDAEQESIKALTTTQSFQPKAVPMAAKAVQEATAARIEFEKANPLIVRLDRWLKFGTV